MRRIERVDAIDDVERRITQQCAVQWQARCKEEHGLPNEDREEADPPKMLAELGSHVGVAPVLVPDASSGDEILRMAVTPHKDQHTNSNLPLAEPRARRGAREDDDAVHWRPR